MRGFEVGLDWSKEEMQVNKNIDKRECYYEDGCDFASVWINGTDGVPRCVCPDHTNAAREDDGAVEYCWMRNNES